MSRDIRYLKAPKGMILSTPADGSQVALQIVSSEMGEHFPTFDEIKQVLLEHQINFGVDDDAITALVQAETIDTLTVIARGIPPQHGDDAALEYHFEINASRSPKVDEHGRIDYKNLDYIQNARAGQVLVSKTPPTAGQPGKSVFGTEIAAKPGRDRKLGQGSNTDVSADGLTLVAKIDGTISYKFGVVSVLPSQDIRESVDSTTGNINCVGSLKVGKNINSDFRVEVEQNLEVNGNVEDAVVQVGGSAIIRGGFGGGGKGKLLAGADVTVKYVENQKVRAGGNIYIGGECHNADVYAEDSVIMQGRPGAIVGGTVAAKHLVRAAVLGNRAGVATHIRVAYDMKTVERLREVGHELERLRGDERRIKEAMVVLYKLEMAGKLPPDKKQALDQFTLFIKDLPNLISELEDERESLKRQLQELAGARVIVDDRVYPGVIVHFGPIYKEIDEELRGPFVLEKVGDTITKSPFDAGRERQLDEEWKRKKAELKGAAVGTAEIDSPAPAATGA